MDSDRRQEYQAKAEAALKLAVKWHQEVLTLEDEELDRVRNRRQNRPSSLGGRETPDWFYVAVGLEQDPVYKRAVALRNNYRNEALLYLQAAAAVKP